MGYGWSGVVDKEWNKTVMMNEVIANTKGVWQRIYRGGQKSDNYTKVTQSCKHRY